MNELSDYKISDGYPDVTGWDVKDKDNRTIGKVDQLLVSKTAERVVYLDVEVDQSIIDAKHDPYLSQSKDGVSEFLNKEGENHIIIPIGLVDLDTDSNFILTNNIDHKTFAETKRYRQGDTVDREYETQVLDSYVRKTNSSGNQDEANSNTGWLGDMSESKLRKIVRDEIRKYHENQSTNDKAIPQRHFSDDVDDVVIMTDEEMRANKNEHHSDWDDDGFYERREFDNDRFRKGNYNS